MSRRALIISDCKDCPHFDNEYYEFLETCTKLKRPMPIQFDPNMSIELKDRYKGRPIPDDCPLPKTEDPVTS